MTAAEGLPEWADVTDVGSPLVAVVLFIAVLVLRLPRFNRRVSRFMDPIVRWWTRGALTDEVQQRERMILLRRVRDVDIQSAFLVELSRWAVAAQLHAASQGLTLDPPPNFIEFRGGWLREHPDYDPLDERD